MEELKTARIMAGYTQAEVSRLLSIPLRTLQNWEEGSRSPATYTLNMLLEFYHNVEDAEITPDEAFRLSRKIRKIKAAPDTSCNTKAGFLQALKLQAELGAESAAVENLRFLSKVEKLVLPDLAGGWGYWYNSDYEVIVQREYWNDKLNCMSFEASDIVVRV